MVGSERTGWKKCGFLHHPVAQGVRRKGVATQSSESLVRGVLGPYHDGAAERRETSCLRV